MQRLGNSIDESLEKIISRCRQAVAYRTRQAAGYVLFRLEQRFENYLVPKIEKAMDWILDLHLERRKKFCGCDFYKGYLKPAAYNVLSSYRESMIGVLPGDVIKEISSHRKRLGAIDEKPEHYLNESLKWCVFMNTIKISAAAGLLSIPYVGDASRFAIGMMAYSLFVEFPFRAASFYIHPEKRICGTILFGMPYQLNNIIRKRLKKNEPNAVIQLVRTMTQKDEEVKRKGYADRGGYAA